jgi:F0F1-type ATP synthase assembly protein I
MTHQPEEHDRSAEDSREPPPPTVDPRLEIPEVLRKPVRQPEPLPSPPQSWGQAAAAWGIALDFVFTIIAGAGLGWLIDRWLNSAPWGVLVGLALGFGAAFVRIVKRTQTSARRKTPPTDRTRR